MTGKPYSMRELKMIVDYLTQHSAYGEIKGRKMWMEFANSHSTSRTWQSLKETFLKRILPDIHNPYYKLTTEQIRSFSQRHDVTAKDKNKLEICSNDAAKINNGDVQKNNEQPSTSNVNEENATTGENLNKSKIPSHDRASTDTLIIEHCYETAEDIQKELEEGNKNDEKETSPTKSLRDLITYSEPLTPMLQSVLNDFTTDDEDENSDREPQMQIVEDNDDQEIDKHGSKSPNDHSENIQTHVTEKPPSPKVGEAFLNDNIKSGNLTRSKSSRLDKVNDSLKSDNNNTNNPLNPENISERDNNETNTVINCKENTSEIFVFEQNLERNEILSNITSDSTIPNNQEALKNKIASNEIPISTSNEIVPSKELSQKKTNVSRKRLDSSNTNESAVHNKRLKQDKTKKSSITDSGSELLLKNVSDQAMPVIEENHVNENKGANNLTENERHAEIITVDTNNVENKNNIANNDISTKEKENTVCKIATESSNGEVHQDITTKQVKMNPCLQSVSLYEEQFSQRKYSDSESSNRNENISTDKQEKQNSTKIKENLKNNDTKLDDNPKNLEVGVVEEVVILKSHSESDSTHNEVKVRRNNLVSQVISKSQRNKALANVFGFSTGSLSANRRNRFNSRRGSSSHRDSRSHIPSESSEWTSESDGDYISPPRARKNRHTRKHLKPQSARILSLEEEGGLFVMYKDKIYPLVKDGKILKKYLRHFSDSEEEDESYWKKKYLEKKKKIQELTRKLEQTKSNSRRARQDSLQENPIPNSTTGSNQDRDIVNGAEQNVAERVENNLKQDKTVKIILTKDKSELQLDGHWQHFTPMLQQVVQILRTDLDAQGKEVPSTNHLEAPTGRQLEAPDKKQLEAPVENQFKTSLPSKLEMPNSIEILSDLTTPTELMPVDKEIREKVNEIETEIFKEIVQRDKTEETNDAAQQNNVTLRKRRGGTGNIPTSTMPSSSKRLKTPDNVKQSEIMETNNKLNIAKRNTDVTKRQTRSPKVKTDSNVKPEERRVFNTRSSRKSEANNASNEDNSQVLYKFPSPPPSRRYKKSDANTKKKTNTPKLSNTYTIKMTQTSFSPDDFCLNAIESSQGYQDSDVSPTIVCHRKKRRHSHSFLTNRGKYFRSTKKRWHPYLTDDLSSESSNSSLGGPIKSITSNSTLDTAIYKSDSYQLLMPKLKSSINQLEKIDESCPASDETNSIIIAISTLLNNDNKYGENSYKEVATNSSHGNTDGGTSSNVSLPLSPELSIVENISISKEILANIEEHPIINETQGNVPERGINNQYTISKLDASMPLMEQECRLQETYRPNVVSDTTAMIENKDIQCSINHESMDYNSYVHKSLISESLLEKICNVNINETSSDFLGQKLQELILQSAKKATKQGVTIKDKAAAAMENKDTEICDVKRNTKSKTTNKRSSTPRKKTNAKNAKIPDIEPVVEEEHMESCSYGSRKSLRSPIHVLCSELNKMDGENKTTSIVKSKSRKKKDVIKVKILKPKRKKNIERTQDHGEVLDLLDETNTHKSTLETANRLTLNHSNISLYTNSGMNDTESGVFLQDFDNSVQLIHNHSDTCLHANECMGDSVEFVKNNSESIISLILDTTNSSQGENDSNIFNMNNKKHKSESFCKNTQDASNLNGEAEYVRAKKFEKGNSTSSKSTLYCTPSLNSLITEDRSDEIQPSLTQSNWYLLSEDENTNTNFSDIFPTDAPKDKRPNFGANLNQLFPITCAVPNLSTITEISKDADENSQQKTDARCDQSGTYSQSIFDSNN